jgi:carbon-monoxide dehydrogenase medium subunit
LSEHGDDAKILAGGHSLIPAMKLRLAEPGVIVDIQRVNGLKGVSESDGKLVIGALTTHHELESSNLVKQKVPILAQTAGEIGDVQVRNKGTLGGSLSHADPAADWPATILALDADLRIVGSSGERIVKATGFFRELYTTVLEADEILAEIHVPIPEGNATGVYLKLHQVASGFALTGVAVVLTKSGDVCQNVAVGITGVSDVPYRATDVESELVGKALTSENIATAAEKAADGVDILEDIHASEAYRANLARVYTRRAIEGAAS